MGVGALNSSTLMVIMLSNGSGCSAFPNLVDIMLSNGSGCSERINGMNSITHYESKVLLSDGSGCSDFPNPNGYHVE